jgi:glycosyltransferase involved in cell wall biosynthesis
MSEPDPSMKIAVIIATRDRCHILSERSIPSVVFQTRRPDFLVIIDDSSPAIRPHNAALVASLQLPNCEVIYQENRRSEGASGSWNTAIDILFTKVNDPERVFVAMLDDDDVWSSTYLEECCAAGCDRQLDMVAADLRRFESVDGVPLVSEGPADLRA